MASFVSGGGGGSSDVFVAEYDTTSNEDVLSAYNAGKTIFAVYDHIVYGLVNYTAGSSNPTNVFTFYAPNTGLRVKEVLCQLQNGTTTVWQNSSTTTSLGNITENGDITGNGVTIANGDRLIINDESASKLNNSSITFGTDTTKYLANDGTWQSIPENTSDLTNDSNFVSDANYVHTDNNFTDTLEAKLNGIAEGATVDDHKWNDVVLNKTAFIDDSDYYIPSLLGTSATSAGLLKVNQQVVNQSIPRRTSAGFIISKTPTTGDNTTKVATTAFVQDALDSLDALPDQTGQSGKFLTTNGTAASWTTANYQPKYTISATTILASGWSNGSYSALQTTYPAASYDLDLELNGDSITSAQQDAWNAAQIVGSATTNVLKALGEVPTIDIPVIVKATPNTDTYLSDVESLLASI